MAAPRRVLFSHRNAAVIICASYNSSMVHCDRNERKNRDKNIAVLLENLPHLLRGLWLSLEEILKILHDGGAKSVSYKELKYLFARSEKIN